MAHWRSSVPSTSGVDVKKRPPPAIFPEQLRSDPNFSLRERAAGREFEQGSLFPNDQLIVPNSVRNIRKGVSLIHAVPTRAEHAQSLNGRRIFDACAVVAQLECRGREQEIVERLKTDRISPIFEVRTSDLASIARIPGKNYQRIHAELDNLFETSFLFNIVGEDGNVEWEMKAHFLSLLGTGKNVKRGYVRFAFDASVLALILEPSMWAKLSLEFSAGLRTSAAYALYQNTFRYIGTQNKTTPSLPTHVWVELIHGPSRYVTETGGQKQVANYADFKRRVLVPAIAMVNDLQALAYSLNMREVKSGNRVVRLQFEMVQKKQRELELPLTWPEDVVKLLQQIGFERREIDDMSQAHSVEEVAEAITRLQAAEKRMHEQGKPVASRRAYFQGILRNIAAGASADAIEQERLAEEIRAEEARRSAERRLQELKEHFERHQRERFGQWLFGLPDGERKQLLREMREDPKTSPAVSRMIKADLTPSDASGQAVLRAWLADARPELIEIALPNPEDRSFENWMAWRLSGGDAIEAG